MGRAVPAQDAGGAAEGRERARLPQDDGQDGRPAGAQRAHGRDLTLALERGAVQRDEQVEQHDEGHRGQDRGQDLFGGAQEIEDVEQDGAGENRLSLRGHVEPAVQAR